MISDACSDDVHVDMGTHASTQHMKAKLINGPPYGIAPRAKDTITDVRTMTARYADVASIVSIPV